MSRPPTRVADIPERINPHSKGASTYKWHDAAAEAEWRGSLESTSKASYGGEANAAAAAAAHGVKADYAMRKADAGRTHFVLGQEDQPMRSQAMSAYGSARGDSSSRSNASEKSKSPIADSRRSQLWASESDCKQWASDLASNSQVTYAKDVNAPIDHSPKMVKEKLMQQSRKSNIVSEPVVLAADGVGSTAHSSYADPGRVQYEKVKKIATQSTAFAGAQVPSNADMWKSTQQAAYESSANGGRIERTKPVYSDVGKYGSHIEFKDTDKPEYKSTAKSEYRPVKFH
eukprot:ANDGO_08250.mRNA.1 hypothetical protein